MAYYDLPEYPLHFRGTTPCCDADLHRPGRLSKNGQAPDGRGTWFCRDCGTAYKIVALTPDTNALTLERSDA